jgi:LacI family transcriptional regulator
VHQSMRALGATAARWLDERILGTATEARREVLPTRLVVRASCGKHESGGSTT